MSQTSSNFKVGTYFHGIMDEEFLLEHHKSLSVTNGALSDDEWLAGLCDKPLPFDCENVVMI
jgi:hypothetical protein